MKDYQKVRKPVSPKPQAVGSKPERQEPEAQKKGRRLRDAPFLQCARRQLPADPVCLAWSASARARRRSASAIRLFTAAGSRSVFALALRSRFLKVTASK